MYALVTDAEVGTTPVGDQTSRQDDMMYYGCLYMFCLVKPALLLRCYCMCHYVDTELYVEEMIFLLMR